MFDLIPSDKIRENIRYEMVVQPNLSDRQQQLSKLLFSEVCTAVMKLPQQRYNCSSAQSIHSGA